MARYLSIADERVELRPDLTPFLHHFTRAAGNHSGFEVLREILLSGELIGSDSASGFIQGNRKAVCLMDVPYPALKWTLQDKHPNGALRYEPYGVSLSKAYALAHGAKPVIYISRGERTELGIPRSEWWRLVRFDYDFEREDDEVTPIRRSDWTHEREWRAPGDLELPANCIVFVDTTKEAQKLAEDIRQHMDDFAIHPRAILPLGVILSCC